MKRRVSALLLALTLAVSLASGAFAATYSNWFKSNYQEMQNLKILPDQFTGMDLKQPITRGEMCLLAVQAFEEATGNDLELDGTQYFTDTNDTNITKAYEYGIVSGYPDGTFRPDQRITRQEFFKLLENFCYSAAFKPVLSVDANALSQFGDASALSSWAKESAQFCVTYSYVNGTKDASGSVVLDPTGTASRQEAMTMFLRAFKRVKEYYYYAVLTAGVSDDGHDTGDTGVTVSDLSKTMYVTAQTLNVRDSWSSGSTLVGTLKYGEAVTVTGRCSNGWMRDPVSGPHGLRLRRIPGRPERRLVRREQQRLQRHRLRHGGRDCAVRLLVCRLQLRLRRLEAIHRLRLLRPHVLLPAAVRLFDEPHRR